MNNKLIKTLLCIAMLICLCLPVAAIASDSPDTPRLEEISFNNAVLNSDFSADAFDYTITLEEPELTPTLKSYKLSGSANIFINYLLDDAGHQNGIVVTVEHSNGASYYNFRYSNAVAYENSNNNYLLDVNCNIGEVYPKINHDDTDYRLYVPSDIVEIKLYAVTEQISAIAEVPSSVTLTPVQEPVIPITVTAANGEARSYNFKVTRLNKTTEEILEKMAEPGFKSIVYGELFYQKPAFAVGIIGAIGGIILLAIFIFIVKRAIIKVDDNDEKEFFNIE